MNLRDQLEEVCNRRINAQFYGSAGFGDTVNHLAIKFFCAREHDGHDAAVVRRCAQLLCSPGYVTEAEEGVEDKTPAFPSLGEPSKTERGFHLIEFKDRYQQDCSLQASSLAEYVEPGTSAVWLGAKPARMHLDRTQVRALIGHLTNWLESGKF